MKRYVTSVRFALPPETDLDVFIDTKSDVAFQNEHVVVVDADLDGYWGSSHDVVEWLFCVSQDSDTPLSYPEIGLFHHQLKTVDERAETKRRVASVLASYAGRQTPDVSTYRVAEQLMRICRYTTREC